MNTRLQVEHPVTELVTGIDLVREQIRIAWGEALSFRQEDVTLIGHAIECRVYAEDPENNFLPSPGIITRLRVPHGNGVRDDGGVYEGAEVSIYYDPMISKFAVYGRNREEAIDRMRRALQEYEIGGIKTTLPFFREIVEDKEFIEGNLDTGFIPRWQQRRQKPETGEIEKDLALVAAALAYSDNQMAVAAGQTNGNSPTVAATSRWVMAGRKALLTNRL
jgi:acetyl-CoA carboxylase biotin carboxylase subunit